MRRAIITLSAALAIVFAMGAAVAATFTQSMQYGDSTHLTCPSGGKIAISTSTAYDKTARCKSTTSPTPSPTGTPSPTTTPDPSPTPTPSPTSGGSYSCTASIGDACGPYDANIPMSNGFNTYVSNQAVNVHGTETVHANSASDWNVVANLNDCGGCVQTFVNVQQLTNDWNPSGSTPAWGGGAADADTPLDALSTLKINYNETSPQTGANYEFAPDVWDDGYANGGNGDVMFWVDTHGRCDEGSFGATVLGHMTMDGQNWTVHRYDSPSTPDPTPITGNEIIFVLDGPGGPGTCAQQPTGTIDVKAGMDWLVAQGNIPAHPVLSQVNTGWELTQSSGQTFTVNNYSIEAN